MTVAGPAGRLARTLDAPRGLLRDAWDDRAGHARDVEFAYLKVGNDISSHAFAHPNRIEIGDAQGQTAMIDARVEDERPRPEKVPERKSRQSQVLAVQHGETLASAARAGHMGEVVSTPSADPPVPAVDETAGGRIAGRDLTGEGRLLDALRSIKDSWVRGELQFLTGMPYTHAASRRRGVGQARKTPRTGTPGRGTIASLPLRQSIASGCSRGIGKNSKIGPRTPRKAPGPLKPGRRAGAAPGSAGPRPGARGGPPRRPWSAARRSLPRCRRRNAG
ncbi:hypothetical protein OJF2_48960 [Aquisphaera giovannonii]|uniref:Uncharacterized protein n=1 Tax=Aquisphaera giovannonii TaxID=406548 RepID=A0A5B9W8C8_9BACT|nr:hypothetical protein OJF2_48960 [Aquisphaera giovannonii]